MLPCHNTTPCTPMFLIYTSNIPIYHTELFPFVEYIIVILGQTMNIIAS